MNDITRCVNDQCNQRFVCKRFILPRLVTSTMIVYSGCDFIPYHCPNCGEPLHFTGAVTCLNKGCGFWKLKHEFQKSKM